MKIRSIDVRDEERLAKLFVACFSWNESWTLSVAQSRIRPMIRTESFCGVIAVEEGEALGMAFGQIEGRIDSSHFLLQEMCVAPNFQTQGIGKAMLNALAEELKGKHGVTSLYLLTDETTPAAHFYGKLRFNRSQRKIVMSAPISGVIEASQHSSLFDTDAQVRRST